MEPNDGKPMVENGSLETLEAAAQGGKLPLTRERLTKVIVAEDEAKKLLEMTPSGCVKRVLNMKDRNYIAGACMAYVQQEGHKKFKDQKKLDQLKKLINFDATLDFTAEMDELLEDRILDWQAATEKYKIWKRNSRGLLSAEEIDAVKKKYPALDLDKEPDKVPLRKPELSPDEQRGPVSTFYIPSKLDAWVQEALRVMEWAVVMTEYSVELCEKFDVEEKA